MTQVRITGSDASRDNDASEDKGSDASRITGSDASRDNRQ